MTHCWQLLFFGTSPPADSAVRERVMALAGESVTRLHVARSTEASQRAQRWSRDPLNLGLTGRIALELADPQPVTLDSTALTDQRPKPLSNAFSNAFSNTDTEVVSSALANALGGKPYYCERYTPLMPSLEPGQAFEGTLQVCCFRRLPDLSDQRLRERWLEDHTRVALSTQSTLGYHQNWVVTPSAPAFDGIVEEYFPPEASERIDWFFNAVDDPVRLRDHIETMTHSTARFLALDTALVQHLSDVRLI
jgi:hypothetical protein